MVSSVPKRVDLEEGIPVRVRSVLNAGTGKILNLSASGAYIATPMFLLPQAQLKLQIVLHEEKRWVDAEAVVVWENRGTVGRRDGLPPGYGLRFLDLPADTLEVIESLLATTGAIEAPELSQQASDASTQADIVPPPSVATGVAHADAVTRVLPSDNAGPVEAGDAATQEDIAIPPSLLHDRKGSDDEGAETEMDDIEQGGPPYLLRGPVVAKVAPASEPGIFVLSYDRTQEARVGRADKSLRETIAGFEGEYSYFYHEVIESLPERYFRECELYHRLGGDHSQLDNTEHPSPPSDTSLQCPVCVSERAV